MHGSATTDQEPAELLPEFVQHRLLVHEGETQQLVDGTPIDIGSLATALNFTGAPLVVSISMRLALQLLKHSGRKPTVAQYQNIAPGECTWPILVMTPCDNAPPFLLDGASRIKRANLLNCQHMQMAFVEEGMVRNFALAPSTIGLDAILDNPDDIIVARLTRLSLAQSQTRVQSQLDKPKEEMAWGTLVPPSPIKPPKDQIAQPDRAYRVFAQYEFGTHIDEAGNRHGGQAWGTGHEKQLRLAIGRIANAFLELRGRVSGAKDRADYLAKLSGLGDRQSEKTPENANASSGNATASLSGGALCHKDIHRAVCQRRC